MAELPRPSNVVDLAQRRADKQRRDLETLIRLLAACAEIGEILDREQRERPWWRRWRRRDAADVQRARELRRELGMDE